ncbi:MAG: hypothetical protein ACK4R8_11015, partial [Thiobacillus sp.]
MIRETQSTTSSQTFRTSDKALIRKDIRHSFRATASDNFALPRRFAQTIVVPPSNQTVAMVGASPGLTAGRGLKHVCDGFEIEIRVASPGLTAGRGLKLTSTNILLDPVTASPGLTAGRGLKRLCVSVLTA